MSMCSTLLLWDHLRLHQAQAANKKRVIVSRVRRVCGLLLQFFLDGAGRWKQCGSKRVGILATLHVARSSYFITSYTTRTTL